MERLLKIDLSRTRVHVGPEPEAIGALAFTRGSDLYFAPGQYAPHTLQGRRLLAHELTHVAQQRSQRVRVPFPFSGGNALVEDPALEAEAQHNSVRAAALSTPPRAQHPLEARSPDPSPAPAPQQGTVQPMRDKIKRLVQPIVKTLVTSNPSTGRRAPRFPKSMKVVRVPPQGTLEERAEQHPADRVESLARYSAAAFAMARQGVITDPRIVRHRAELQAGRRGSKTEGTEAAHKIMNLKVGGKSLHDYFPDEDFLHSALKASHSATTIVPKALNNQDSRVESGLEEEWLPRLEKDLQKSQKGGKQSDPGKLLRSHLHLLTRAYNKQGFSFSRMIRKQMLSNALYHYNLVKNEIQERDQEKE
jgi:hypothetical protein